MVASLSCAFAHADSEWSGYLSFEPRYFPDEPLFPEQPPAGLSAAAVLAPEFHHEWNGGDDRFGFSPQLRWDGDDKNRTAADVREAYWLHHREPWTLQLGVGQVFWGVTESRHLVDIVNQVDWVGDVDEEDRLGQPLLSLLRGQAFVCDELAEIEPGVPVGAFQTLGHAQVHAAYLRFAQGRVVTSIGTAIERRAERDQRAHELAMAFTALSRPAAQRHARRELARRRGSAVLGRVARYRFADARGSTR